MLKFMIFLSVTMGIPFHEIRQWSSAEIALYRCYYKVAPWGEERADIRNAMSMQLTAAVHGNKRTIEDFLPFREKPKVDTESQAQILRASFAAMARRSKKTPSGAG